MFFRRATDCDQIPEIPSYPQNGDFNHVPFHDSVIDRQAACSLAFRFSLSTFLSTFSIYGPMWINWRNWMPFGLLAHRIAWIDPRAVGRFDATLTADLVAWTCGFWRWVSPSP